MNRRRFFAVSWLLALLPASVRAQLDPIHGCTPTFRHGRLQFDPECTMTIPGAPFEITPPLHLITPFTEGGAATDDFTPPRQRRRANQRERRRRRHEGQKDSRKNNGNDCNPKPKARTCDGTCGTVRNNCGRWVDCGPCTCATGCHPDCQTCNAATGRCDPINTGKSCDDGNPCTVEDQCQDGLCVGDPIPGCPVTNTCPAAGTCAAGFPNCGSAPAGGTNGACICLGTTEGHRACAQNIATCVPCEDSRDCPGGFCATDVCCESGKSCTVVC